MKSVLVQGLRICDIVAVGSEFPVASPMHWLQAPDDVSPETYYTDGVSILPKPPEPIQNVKAAKKTAIEASRDAATVANVIALGTTWQADARSQKLLGDAITLATAGLPLPPVWRDALNNDMPITNIGQLLAIAGAMAAQTQAAYSKSWTLKSQVDAAPDAATVNTITW